MLDRTVAADAVAKRSIGSCLNPIYDFDFLLMAASLFQGRAKQLYAAGYKKVDDVARTKSKELVAKIEHMTVRVANQLISAAKVKSMIL